MVERIACRVGTFGQLLCNRHVVERIACVVERGRVCVCGRVSKIIEHLVILIEHLVILNEFSDEEM